MFRDRLPLAEEFCRLLATEGVVRGLIGPREAPRLWERHLLNCAVVAELIPEGRSVADIGSGAGLPGLVLAVVRPDLEITLIEPLLRRTTFLEEVRDELGLEQVEVVRARAEEVHGTRTFDRVTSRAVAPLDRLLTWSVPLLAPRGEIVAMKGSSAPEELASVAATLPAMGIVGSDVVTVGDGVVDPQTTVIRLVAGDRPRIGSVSSGAPRRRGPRSK